MTAPKEPKTPKGPKITNERALEARGDAIARIYRKTGKTVLP